MPQIDVVIYCKEDKTAPLIKWLDNQPNKVQDKVMARKDTRTARGSYERPEEKNKRR